MRLQTTRYHPMDDPDFQSDPHHTREEPRRSRKATTTSTSEKKDINTSKLQEIVTKIGDPKPGSSLTIKVAGGAQKTTPPKQLKSTKKNMRRRRTDYYDEASSSNTAMGGGYNNDVLYGPRTASSGAVNREKRASSSSQHKKRLEMDDGSNWKKPEKLSGRKKEKYSHPGETDEIPIGQWVVIICVILGFVGHHIRKNYGMKKKVTVQQKTEKHSGSLHSASHGHKRRKKIHGKHGSKKTKKGGGSNRKTAVSKQKDVSLQEHQESSSHVEAADASSLQNSDQPASNATGAVSQSDTADVDPEPAKEIVTSTVSTKKKKKKKSKSSQQAKQKEPKEEKHPKSTPDSVSTDGSSSTAADGVNDPHPEVDHLVLLPDDEDNHTFENEEKEGEGWTTVGPTSTKQRSAKSELHVKTDEDGVNDTSQSATDGNVAEKVVPQPDESMDVTAKIPEEEGISNANETKENKETEKQTTETAPPVENKGANSSEEQLTTPTYFNEGVEPAKDSDASAGEVTEETGHSETRTETAKDSLPTEEEDAAFARMLQKQEEEMAAQAMTSGLELVSNQLPKHDTWEEVNHKKRRSRKAVSEADDSQD